jgi:hypothetical protein
MLSKHICATPANFGLKMVNTLSHREVQDSARLMAMNNRAVEVLKEVAKRAWEDY